MCLVAELADAIAKIVSYIKLNFRAGSNPVYAPKRVNLYDEVHNFLGSA